MPALKPRDITQGVRLAGDDEDGLSMVTPRVLAVAARLKITPTTAAMKPNDAAAANPAPVPSMTTKIASAMKSRPCSVRNHDLSIPPP
jgi:hypothetical protein